jgi:hypothetical protein
MKEKNKKNNNGFVDFISIGYMNIKFVKLTKIMLFFISLLLIPNLVLATFEIKCSDPLLPKNIIADTIYSFSCALKNDEGVVKPVFVELNITEKTGTFPLWLNDFSIGAEINSDSLNCTEKINGTFYCYNGTEENEYEINPGISMLNLNMTSKPNLYPSDYIFSLSVFTNSPIQATTPSTSATATGGFGYVRKATTTTTTVPTTTTTTTPTTTVPTPTTTTTITPSPISSPITGFMVFASSPLGISLLLSLIVVTVLIIIFYKKRYNKEKPEEKKLTTF